MCPATARVLGLGQQALPAAPARRRPPGRSPFCSSAPPARRTPSPRGGRRPAGGPSVGPRFAKVRRMIDELIYAAVFSTDAAAKADARKQIHLRARQAGAVPSSIYPLYRAIGRGEVTRKFTVPAFNIRALTYDVARALFRAAMRNNVGPFIFAIARR